MASSMDVAGQTIAAGQFDKTVHQLELLDQALKDFRFWFEKDDKLKAAFELAVANLEDAIGFMEGLAREGEILNVVNDLIETARRMSQEDVARHVEQILAITDPLIRHLMELDDPDVIEGLRTLTTAEASSWLAKVSPDPRSWLLGAMQEGFVLALARVGTQLNSAGTTLLLTPIAFLIGFCCPDDCTLGSITNCRVSAVSVVLAGHTPGSEKTLQKVTPQQGKGIVQGWKAIWKNTQLVDIYVKCAWQKCENTGCFPCLWQTDTDWVDKESDWIQVKNPGTLGPSWLPPSVWDQADKKNFQDLATAICSASCK
jgi:hypothetical protein